MAVNLPDADAASMRQARGAPPREGLLVCRVGLFLDDRRPCYLVDPALEHRALVVQPVDGARKLDETLPEVAALLQAAHLVLDVPQPAVDPEEFLLEGRKLSPIEGRAGADFEQAVEFAVDIGLRGRGADAFPLDAQYRNLVDQFADRNRSKDVNHRDLSCPGSLQHQLPQLGPARGNRTARRDSIQAGLSTGGFLEHRFDS